MRKAIEIIAPILLVLCACTGEGGSPQVDQRFVGDWIIDQPSHAGYEASVYRFGADGSLELLETCDVTGADPDYVTGTVAHELGPLRCDFDADWWASDSSTLRVGGACTDGQRREIALRFDSPASANAEGATVSVVDVDGETGWDHRAFAWRWIKCPAEGCTAICQ